jgi:hypothetical protein
MQIWTITTAEDGKDMTTAVVTTKAAADNMAQGTVNGWWWDTMDGTEPPEAEWRVVYAALCENSGFLDQLAVAEHQISAVALDADERATIIAALTDWLNAGLGDPDNRTDEQQALACPNDNSISLDEIGISALIDRLHGETP